MSETEEHFLSTRGERLTLPGLPYMGGVMAGFMNPYDAEKNPDGVILMVRVDPQATPNFHV